MAVIYRNGTYYGNGGGGGGAEYVQEGYYNSADGLLYEESTFTTPITGETNVIYRDPTTEFQYIWDGTDFVNTNTISVELDTQADYDSLSTAEKLSGKVFYIKNAYPSDRYVAATGFTPVGTVISVMGTTAPKHYLACDGATYNIADYPELANYFTAQFGSANNFGGDGTTTFAVPDLRGEFLRGTGTNSHTNQGDGAAVGTHQDATNHVLVVNNVSNNNVIYDKLTNNTYQQASNADKIIKVDGSGGAKYYLFSVDANNKNIKSLYTARPTNTSVLYCIATKNIYIEARNNFSTEEQVIGTWIDGKPLYQRTFYDPALSYNITSTCLDETMADLTSWNIDKLVDIKGRCHWNTSDALILPFSIKYDTLEICVDTPIFGNRLRIRGYRNSGSSPCTDIAITVQYTKTTD